MNLQDRRVLVTGASGGIGAALVTVLLERGAEVLVSGRNQAALTKVVSDHPLRESAEIFVADLSSVSDRIRLCERASSWRGGVDVLINNAAVSDFSLLGSASAESVDAAITTNLVAPVDLCRRLSGHFERRNEAHIVNIGSVFGSIGFAGSSVYCATKFGLRGFSEALRRELADTGTRVHYFAPRATRTAFNSESVDLMNEALGNASDDPMDVAWKIVTALEAGRVERIIGWPETFFARVNALLPRVVDAAVANKLRIIKDFAKRSSVMRPASFNHSDATTSEVL